MKKTESKIKGISFGVLLAGKVADGSKTVTRRVADTGMYCIDERHPIETQQREMKAMLSNPKVCPYQVGQILYVREPWQVGNAYDKPSGSGHIPDNAMVNYLSDKVQIGMLGRRRIARFMPKRFARTFIQVTGVRCERLLEISEEDAVREGIDFGKMSVAGLNMGLRYKDYSLGGVMVNTLILDDCVGSFYTLWDAVNGKDAHLQNPWVWVIEFQKVEMPNPWNEEMGFAWGWRRAMVGFVSDACTGLVLQVVPDMATGLVVGFLNETNLGDYKTYPAAQLACQEAARNHFLNLSK